MEEYLFILRRVGKVLIILGLIDVAVMIYCIVKGVSYSSFLNIFAVIAGIFLMRGSPRAVRIITLVGTFILSFCICLVILWPFTQPVDLTLLSFKLYWRSMLISYAVNAFVLAVLFWIVRQLRQRVVLEALLQKGSKIVSVRLPALVGIGMVAALVIFLNIMLSGTTAQRAKQVAAKRLGNNYKYHVSSLSTSYNAEGKRVSATVTAYSSKEIHVIPVNWKEK